MLEACRASAALQASGRTAEAGRLAAAAAETAEAAARDGRLSDPFLRVLALDQLAGTREAAEDAARAGAEAEALAREVLPPGDPRLAVLLNNAGTHLKQRGDFAGAEPRFREALELAESRGPEALVGTACLNLCDVLRARDAAAEALPFARRAAREIEARAGTFDPATADALDNLAAVLEELGRSREAARQLRRVEAIYHRRLGEAHPLTRTAARRLEELRRAAADPPEP